MEKEIPQRKSAVEKLRRQFHSEVTVRLIICLSQPLSSPTLDVILFSFISCYLLSALEDPLLFSLHDSLHHLKNQGKSFFRLHSLSVKEGQSLLLYIQKCFCCHGLMRKGF